MSDKSERLFEALNELSDKSIDEGAKLPDSSSARPQALKRRPSRRRWAAMAACLALVVGGGALLLIRMGGRAGGSGTDGSSTFMSYAGPVFPLTLAAENDAVSAQRDITLDFAPWMPEWISNEAEAASRDYLTEEERQDVLEQYNEWFPEGGRYERSTDIRVSDRYTLTNRSDQDQTVTLLYPFAASLQALMGDPDGSPQPSLVLDGQALEEAQLVIGAYSGDFEGVWDGTLEGDPAGTANLDSADSWEDYKALLADGSYQENALGPGPDVRDLPVTVYRFTEPYGPEADEEAGRPNPSIQVEFQIDYAQTTVLSCGFHAGRNDPENGIMVRGFSIPEPRESRYGESFYLLVLGEDITGLTTQGYVTGGADSDTETLDGCGVTVERYESDLDTMFRQILPGIWGVELYDETQMPDAEFERCYRAFLEHLLSYGLLSDTAAERYSAGMIEEIAGEVLNIDRVCWLEAEITIPAGGSVTVEAEMTKAGSFDYACAHRKNQGIYGYDLVTALGSNLRCTAQRATLEDRGQIELVRQNFGFDLAANVRTVELDPATEHYYLEVRRIDTPDPEPPAGSTET